jgi:hypothetical protein
MYDEYVTCRRAGGSAADPAMQVERVPAMAADDYHPAPKRSAAARISVTGIPDRCDALRSDTAVVEKPQRLVPQQPLPVALVTRR